MLQKNHKEIIFFNSLLINYLTTFSIVKCKYSPPSATESLEMGKESFRFCEPSVNFNLLLAA